MGFFSSPFLFWRKPSNIDSIRTVDGNTAVQSNDETQLAKMNLYDELLCVPATGLRVSTPYVGMNTTSLLRSFFASQGSHTHPWFSFDEAAPLCLCFHTLTRARHRGVDGIEKRKVSLGAQGLYGRWFDTANGNGGNRLQACLDEP